MTTLLLAVIYAAFISLGLPDSVLGAAWPTMHGPMNVPVSWLGLLSTLISISTVISSLMSDRVTFRFGPGRVTAFSVALTAAALFGFSCSTEFWMLCLIGIPSIISGIVALLLQRGMKARDAKQEEIRSQSLAVENQNRAIMMGLQAILRDRLLHSYRHYFAKGWADYDDRENLENIWRQYHMLGANGIMDEYRKRFLALPVSGGKDTNPNPENEMEE